MSRTIDSDKRSAAFPAPARAVVPLRMTATCPWPPPTQSVARPRPAFRRRISCSRVTRIRPPLAPIGYPSASAPPCGLILSMSMSMSSSRSTASDCAANASLSSNRSMSASSSPARVRALRTAGTGPMPMIFGSTPTEAWLSTVPKVHRPRSRARRADITTIAAALSLTPEALPAVTVPPSRQKAARSLDSAAAVVPGRGCSSLSTIRVPS
jgi:hypothetical protein